MHAVSMLLMAGAGFALGTSTKDSNIYLAVIGIGLLIAGRVEYQTACMRSAIQALKDKEK